jgi:hypothetical protein
VKAVCALALFLLPSAAWGQARETPLLQDDLQSNRRTRIDAPTDELDASLDAMMGGSGGFSTRELEKIEDRLRADLRRERPRATPRLIIFLYPGKVNAERLRAMSEIFVDMELVMDPCERTVCRDAVARHIELVGRAVGKPVLATQSYKVVWKTLTLKTSTAMHGDEVAAYQVPITDCIAAAARAGGGMAWLDARKHAEDDYEPLMVKAIAGKAQARRVALLAPPSVRRRSGAVDVALKVRGDRSRAQQQVVDALWAAAAGLKTSPASPSSSELEVALEVPMKGSVTRKFRAPGASVGQYVDGNLDSGTLWSSYVEELQKDAGAARLAFSDADVAGHGAAPDAPEPDDNEAIATLSANFSQLGGCARTEAARNRSFRGVTLTFRWLPNGHAEGAAPKEPALRGTPLARCLAGALDAIRLPRFTGMARTIEYPIRVK